MVCIKQVFRSNSVRINEVPLYMGKILECSLRSPKNVLRSSGMYILAEVLNIHNLMNGNCHIETF